MPPSLDDLVPSGLVRLADGPTFTFAKEGHRSCARPLPAAVADGADDGRLRRAPPRRRSAAAADRVPFGRERAYLQAELPPSWAARLSVPPLWRSVGVAQAQAMRLW